MPSSSPSASGTEDRELRNITYRASDGRFCIIDFEFATLLEGGEGTTSLGPAVVAQ